MEIGHCEAILHERNRMGRSLAKDIGADPDE
jgi:hypothetical protein